MGIQWVSQEDRYFIWNCLVFDMQGDATDVHGHGCHWTMATTACGVGYRALGLVTGYTTDSHSLVLTPTQRGTQDQRGGTVSPSLPGSKQSPPASSFSSLGTVINQRECSRQQSSNSVILLYEHLFTRTGLSTHDFVLSRRQGYH